MGTQDMVCGLDIWVWFGVAVFSKVFWRSSFGVYVDSCSLDVKMNSMVDCSFFLYLEIDQTNAHAVRWQTGF
jgi:hypothetical protein